MSHFTVLVITPNQPTHEMLTEILQPWHEFECTGTDDRYVQDIDITAELRERYESDTRTMLTAPDGSHHNRFDKAFYREPTQAEAAEIASLRGLGLSKNFRHESRNWEDGRGHRAKVHFVPEGYAETEVPLLHLKTFREFVASQTSVKRELAFGATADKSGEHKYGITVLREDGSVERVIDRTNPDKKWDWWTVGGRWTGMFKLKAGVPAILGRPGIMTDEPEAGRGDQAQVDQIDFAGMRDDAGTRAGERWDAYRAIVGLDATWLSWDEVRAAATDIDAARATYWAQDALERLKVGDTERKFAFAEHDDFLRTRDDFVRRARDGAISTFAVVKDGGWFERGRMGWWAVVHDEKQEGEWEREFAALLDGLPPTTWLTAIDCHI